MDMELIVAFLALVITFWQLYLQRKQMRASSRIDALIHVAGLLNAQIEHYERIIESMKKDKKDWLRHAARVNDDLRPLLSQVNRRLLASIDPELQEIDGVKLKKLLKFSHDETAA